MRSAKSNCNLLKVLPPVTYTEGIPEWMKLRIHSVYVQGVKHPVDRVVFSLSCCCCCCSSSGLFRWRRHHHLCPSVRFGWLPPNVRSYRAHIGVASFLPSLSYLICAASGYVCVCVCVGLYRWPIKEERKKKERRPKSVCGCVCRLPFFFFFFYNSCGLVRKINTLREKKKKEKKWDWNTCCRLHEIWYHPGTEN